MHSNHFMHHSMDKNYLVINQKILIFIKNSKSYLFISLLALIVGTIDLESYHIQSDITLVIAPT